MFHNEITMTDTSKMMPLLGLDAVQKNNKVVLLAKKEFVGYDV